MGAGCGSVGGCRVDSRGSTCIHKPGRTCGAAQVCGSDCRPGGRRPEPRSEATRASCSTPAAHKQMLLLNVDSLVFLCSTKSQQVGGSPAWGSDRPHPGSRRGRRAPRPSRCRTEAPRTSPRRFSGCVRFRFPRRAAAGTSPLPGHVLSQQEEPKTNAEVSNWQEVHERYLVKGYPGSAADPNNRAALLHLQTRSPRWLLRLSVSGQTNTRGETCQTDI